MNHKKISDIVDDNYIYASVLYYFGIEFYDYSEETLAQVCTERGLNINVVIEKLESVSDSKEQPPILDSYPIDLIIEYLKHAHYIFIKQKLPYIARVINNFSAHHSSYNAIEKDLKFVFPLFVEDFIHHIYEEEDTLFFYIEYLQNFLKGKGNISKVYYLMENHSIQTHAMEHEQHDDEMQGIRKITQGYHTDESTPLHVKVIYSELKALESSLITHARVENEILFPKALMLEKEIKASLAQKIALN